MIRSYETEKHYITILSENMSSKKNRFGLYLHSTILFPHFITAVLFFSMSIYYICAYFLCHFFRSSQINGHFLYENEAKQQIRLFYTFTIYHISMNSYGFYALSNIIKPLKIEPKRIFEESYKWIKAKVIRDLQWKAALLTLTSKNIKMISV